MNLLPLLWQVPAIFTAVPMIARLLPFKLATRAIPLFYTLVSLVVMTMPDRLDLALAAAGLVSYLHQHVGVRLSAEEPPDMQEVADKLRRGYDVMANLLVMGYERVSRAAPRNSVQDPTLHDEPDDGNPEHEYSEPPKAPPEKIPKHIPRL